MSRLVDDWITGYMEYLDEIESPDIYILWTAISVIAGALQRKCFLPWGSLTFYPNMYVVLVGPSGVRKGTAMDPGRTMLEDLGIKMAAEATTRESLIRELKTASNSNVDEATGKPIFHSSLTIYSQELTVFLGQHNQQLISDLTDWYDCRSRWVYRTKTQGSDDIIGVFVNLIGATTPSVLQLALPQDAIGGGLTSRMIFVYAGKKRKTNPFPFFNKNHLALRDKLFVDLEKIHMMSGNFTVSQNFIDLWADWYLAQEDNPPFKDARFGGYIERRPNHIFKLSMILCASRTDTKQITGEDLQRAINILEATEEVMPMAFSGVGQSPTAGLLTRIAAYMASAKEVTKTELVRQFYYDADTRTLDMVMETLISMNYVKRVENLQNGTTTFIYLEEKCETDSST